MHNSEESFFWYVARRKIIEKVIKNNINLENKENLKVLEIGCGTGGNLVYFSKIFPKIQGVECCEKAITFAKQKTKIKMQTGKLPDDLPFKKEKFDIIFMFDVLEHIEEENKTLKKIHQILNEQGKLIITVPAFKLLWSNHDTRNQHYRRYTKGMLKQSLIKGGFKINYSNYFNFLLFLPIFITRMLDKGKSKHEENNDIKNYNKITNNLLRLIMESEKYLMKYLRFPWGVSVISIAQK